MKIELPNGSDKSNNKESKKSNLKKPKKIGKKMPTEITWEESEEEEFIKSYINFKLVKINTVTFDIHLPNNFKMSNNSSLEEAKNKAVLLFN